ncbi:exosortase-associated EpsI family protein [Poriferisphaera sp. WC338]|uniref:exosortase-associated EpsI family protein n=1 Tax=Poriferisphaera sp. WC338 TaxID=3425129 RepID=UPI003D81361D
MAKPSHIKNTLIVIIAIAVLVGVGITTAMRPKPQDASAFHALAGQAVLSLPKQIGDWSSKSQEIPAAAIKLLNTNDIISRTYVNNKTGLSAALLLIYTKDARDMLGHYPPVCYPANGYKQISAAKIDWPADNLNMTGMDYTFVMRQGNTNVGKVNVANFILLPSGRIVRDMNELDKTAADYTRHFYGAAQLQLVTAPQITDKQRQQIFNELIGSNVDIINTLIHGVSDDTEQTTPSDTDKTKPNHRETLGGSAVIPTS